MGIRRRLGGGGELDGSLYIVIGEGPGWGGGGLGRGVDAHRSISVKTSGERMENLSVCGAFGSWLHK